MGESPNQPFQLSFNASLKIDFQGSRVTSDGGLILVRELDERLGFGERADFSRNTGGSRKSVGGMAPKRASSGLGGLSRGKTGLLRGAFKLRTGCRLPSGRSGGTLSAGLEFILEIPEKTGGS